MAQNKVCLVTGASGMLGAILCRCFLDAGFRVFGQFNSNPVSIDGVVMVESNLTDVGASEKIVKQLAPSLVVHCAAMTDVDKCEQNPKDAFRVNAEVTGSLAHACDGAGAKFVYISTDQLWKDVEPFADEKLPLDPVNVYGASKGEGERLSVVNGTELIVRTNFFAGSTQRKSSPIQHILSVLKSGAVYSGFKDVFYTPIEGSLLANLIMMAIVKDLHGVYAIVGRDRISKFEFAHRVATFFGVGAGLVQAAVVADAQLTAPRPKEMSLSTHKIEQALNVVMPLLGQSLQAYKDNQKEM